MNALPLLSSLCEPSALLIAGFGDTSRADDGIGLLIARRLTDGIVPAADFWLEGDTASLPTPESRERIVLIDSVITGAPGGTVHLSRNLSYPTPRALRRHGRLEGLDACEGAVALIGIEIERLTTDAPPSQPVGQAAEWVVSNFPSLITMLDLMDEATVRLSPPSFIPRRYRLY